MFSWKNESMRSDTQSFQPFTDTTIAERNITSYAHCLPDKNKLFIVLQEIYHYPLQEGYENMAKKNTNHLPQHGATQINMSNKPQTHGEEQ